MTVTAIWLALMVFVPAWEVVSRHSGGRWSSLGRIGSVIVARLPGRLGIVLLWGYVGWHLFARYTVPR